MSTEIQNTATGKNDSAIPSTKLRGTWADEVMRAEQTSDHSSSRDSSTSPVNVNNISNSSTNSQDRQITVEFIDDENEKKYKRLQASSSFKCLGEDEKIKTPVKRRHANDSGSTSPNGLNSDNSSEFSEFKDGKRLRHNSQASSNSSAYTENDPAVLSRRQKQIDYGKNTVAYERYVDQVPRNERTRDHPRTPNKYGRYSRRAFDGLVKIWRKQLHHYDPPNKDVAADSDDTSSDESE